MRYFKCVVLLLALLLVGCKEDLYRDLPQEEANRMVALLLLNNIDARNVVNEKSGMVTLQVNKSDLINAVELLRQNGLPRPHYTSIEEMFPSGQLVTSPAQEEAKMGYLKEQRLESTLNNVEGVISAKVLIATSAPDMESTTSAVKSAAVYIQYSPQVNLNNYENKIKQLVQNAIPDLGYDRISVFLQASTYNYKLVQQEQDSPTTGEVRQTMLNNTMGIVKGNSSLILGILAGLMLTILMAIFLVRRS